MAFTNGWLWFQTAFSIWQFIRVAKYFRMPFAIIYTSFGFLFQDGPYPFEKRRVFYIKLGGKWPYDTDLKTELGDKGKNGCYLIKRYGTSYALKGDDYINLHTMDVKNPELYCTEKDLLGGNCYIVNKVEFGEALEAYLKPENKEEVLEMRVLVYPSEEINKNLMRLFSIVPLLLQANQMKVMSITASFIIVFIDIFSNILEKRCWLRIKLKLKNFMRFQLGKMENRSLRSLISKYLSSISMSLQYCDDFTCNFKQVVQGEIYLIMPNTYLDGFENSYSYAPIKDVEIEEYERVLKCLPEEDHNFIDKHNKAQKLEGREGYFSIQKGSNQYTVKTRQGDLKCVFVPDHGMAYNFLDGVELHWGPYRPEYSSRILLFLNEISKLNYLPFTMSIKRTYHTEGYDRVFDHVANGGWFLIARANHEGFVS